MIHRDTIFKILGSLLFIEVAIMLACFAMAIGFGEDDEMPFAISIVLTLLTGIVLRYLGRHSDNTMSRRDAYLVVSLSWVIFSFFGTLPFVISGYIPSSPTPISKPCQGSPPQAPPSWTMSTRCPTACSFGAA